MEIERTTFGTITIDGKTYEHDVIIRLLLRHIACPLEGRSEVHL